MEEKYTELLQAFHVNTMWNDILETPKGYRVTMDHIHDAVLYQGLSFVHEVKYYQIKAYQLANDEYNREKRRAEIVKQNASVMDTLTYNLDTELDYGFTDDELQVVIERLAGIPSKQSKFKNQKYYSLLKSIKQKILNDKASTMFSD